MQKNTNFWKKLPKPFSVLAPMADITDPPFRSIIAKYGKPDVLYTEFVSCDGLCSNGFEVLVKDFGYSNNEHPIVAQIFGAKPENFYTCAKLIHRLGFDGIDINMGCPDRNVMKQNAGAALIGDSELAKEILVATKEGASGLPVSVKTRIGDVNDELEKWIPKLLSVKPDAIIMHARTRKELSNVPANWEYIRKTVELAAGSETIIIGNGDVNSLEKGNELALLTGADGIMYGRAIFGNPWFFNTTIKKGRLPLTERLRVLDEHTHAFEKYYASKKNFSTMKKHFKSYIKGFPQAKELRTTLMTTKNAKQVSEILNNFIEAIT